MNLHPELSSNTLLTPPTPKADRRRRLRFPLHAPCRFWWFTPEGGLMFEAGVTLDLSADGIRITTKRNPEVGSFLSVEVDLPKLESTQADTDEDGLLEGPGFLPLRGEGRVVWEDAGGGRFAAQICFCTLHSARIESVPKSKVVGQNTTY